MWALRAIAQELVPRLVTEYVTVFSDEAGHLQLFCLAEQHCLLEDGEPDGVVLVSSLAWLGMGLTYCRSKDVLSWDEYLAEKEART